MLFAEVSDAVWLAAIAIPAMIAKEYFIDRPLRKVEAERVAKHLIDAAVIVKREAIEAATELKKEAQAVASKVAEVAEKAAAVEHKVAVVAEKAAVVAQKAAIVAEKVKEVKEVLATTSDKTTTTLDSVHTLVNSKWGVQLKLTAVMARQLAMMRPDSKIDADAANEAEKLLAEHDASQSVVDAK